MQSGGLGGPVPSSLSTPFSTWPEWGALPHPRRDYGVDDDANGGAVCGGVQVALVAPPVPLAPNSSAAPLAPALSSADLDLLAALLLGALATDPTLAPASAAGGSTAIGVSVGGAAEEAVADAAEGNTRRALGDSAEYSNGESGSGGAGRSRVPPFPPVTSHASSILGGGGSGWEAAFVAAVEAMKIAQHDQVSLLLFFLA